MQKWQYMSICVKDVGVPGGGSDFRPHIVNGRKLPKWEKGQLAAEHLDQLGAEGWELVGVATNNSFYEQILYFKRPAS